MSTTIGTAARRAELAARWRDLDARVGAACAAAGRERGEVSVVAVTKTFPAEDVAVLADLGFSDVGENRDQEAAAKAARCRELGVSGLRWHFVGQLQTNKVRSVAAYADVVHSLDRARLVGALDRAAERRGRRLRALVQVDLDTRGETVTGETRAPAQRGGAAPDDVAALCAALEAAPHLELGGLMAVAPLGADPNVAFADLAALAARLRPLHPGLTWLSAGMSEDLEAAVAHGATHLRVGRALLGSRPPLG